MFRRKGDDVGTLSEEIKAKALDLGFCGVGIARAGQLEQESKRLVEWLARGYHGTMEWMARNLEKRIDPAAILPSAKSVVAVAMNYYSDVRHRDEPGLGKISRYAWGDDYHDVLRTRLGQLLEFVMSQAPGTHGMAYVDTGPVLDKIWAQKAGIGWEGKHSNVITKSHGSWVFLGEIMLDIELEYDSPATDHCGSCTLCIEACPTGAITEPYVVDSNRCISYLTIEHRGDLDPELAEKFDNWIYGCDICQDVCPWNRKFATSSNEPGFYPRPHAVAPQLGEWAKMTEEEFSANFRGSAVKRTKLGGLLRNVRAVLQRRRVNVVG